MRNLTHRSATALVAVALALFFAAGPARSGQTPSASVGPAELKISGAVETPLTLTEADLKKMPRKTLSVVNPHEKKTEVYEGVALAELLHRAGAPQGAQLRG